MTPVTAVVTTVIVTCIYNFITQLTSADTITFPDTKPDTESKMTPRDRAAPPPPVLPPFVLTARTKWTVDVVAHVLAAVDRTASQRAAVSVLGRGPIPLRDANEVYYALPEEKGDSHGWEISLVDLRKPGGRRLFVPDGRFDARILSPPSSATKAQGHSAPFEDTALPWQLGALPTPVAVCVVLAWLTRVHAARLDKLHRLRIKEAWILDDLNALLRGEPWQGSCVYLEPLSRKATHIDGASLRAPKRARR